MRAPLDPTAHAFFATRTGVCVYVRVEQRTFRVQFVSAEAQGTVSDGGNPDARTALELARAALRRHHAELARLFEKVALSQT